MENASKALIMAGSVLIAVAIISLALYAYSNYREYARSSEQKLTLAQIENFNRFYESYEISGNANRISANQYRIRGVDVLNIYNKAVGDKKSDDSFTIKVFDGVVNSISGDSDTFIKNNYYVKYSYDIYGKISEVELGKN